MVVSKPFKLTHRIGGLETQRSIGACVPDLTHRIGGLETELIADIAKNFLTHRIGGLETRNTL